MESIVTVSSFTKDGKTKVVFNSKHFLTAGYVKKLTGIGCNYNILVGSSIDAEYYKVGDVIDEDKKLTCTKDDTIIKSAVIVLSPMLQQAAIMAAFNTAV